jgi:hypothetical protein
MSIKVTLTEEEILETPNDMMLGELTRNKHRQAMRDAEGPRYDDEHFGVVIGEDGLFTSLIHSKDQIYDKCVLCGKESPYLKNTHVDFRFGYVEGAGQGCFQPNQCDK